MDTPSTGSPADPAPAPAPEQGKPVEASAESGTPAATPATPEAPKTPPDVVVFRNVTKRFNEKVAIQDVSFAIEDLPSQGELIAIVGPSGCGKSTVLRIMAGLRPHFPPTSGEALVSGHPILGPGADRGLVDQKYSLLPHLTVLDNVSFGLKLRGMERKERRNLAREWVKKVGLQGSETKYPSELSGGMQQRVALAATLILSPRILLMDEPFGALDPRIRLRMQELLIQLWNEQNSTVFLVTHSVEEAVYLGDRIFRMGANPGRLVEIIPVPRPHDPPETWRKQKWFTDLTQDLLHRLEQDAPASL